MKRHFTKVGRPPVERKEGNCPHCNSEKVATTGLWACGSQSSRQSRSCRIFQLEAEIERLQAAMFAADTYLGLMRQAAMRRSANKLPTDTEMQELTDAWEKYLKAAKEAKEE